MAHFAAREFEKSMKGIGYDEFKLIRLVSRFSKCGLIPRVKIWYEKLYGKSLKERIKGECKGNFLKLILACLDREVVDENQVM